MSTAVVCSLAPNKSSGALYLEENKQISYLTVGIL